MSQAVFDATGFGSDAHWIEWREVVAVGLRATSDGPLVEDLFWQFVLADRLIEVPASWIQGAASEVVFVAFPGLDMRKLAVAMGSSEDRQFCVWDRHRSPVPDRRCLRERFGSLVQRLGASGDAAPLAERLLTAWAEPQRRYHDTEHLAECLATLDVASPPSAERDIAELALWYHDAVYSARARDNEERSAAWLESDGDRLAIPRALTERASRLVRATAHSSASCEGDDLAALVCDVDLAILGREPLRFFEFEDSVREEFSHVRALAFAVGRGRFLAALLRHPRIYRTEWAHEQFEAAARRNIRALLATPRYAAWRYLRWLPGLEPR